MGKVREDASCQILCSIEESEKHKVEYEVHRLVVNKDPKFIKIVEVRSSLSFLPAFLLFVNID
ncbi:hypothetical protein AMTRI_Chr01g107650 [Amborella trichopoda]